MQGRRMSTSSGPSGPRLIRRDAALADGTSESELRRARQRGVLTPIVRGVYLPVVDAAGLDCAGRHLAEVEAIVPRLTGEPVVSHVSAAVVHGLPFWHSEMPAVHITRDRSAKARRGPRLQAHRAVIYQDEVCVVGGLRVTSIARTVVDCARLLPFDNAVVLADAALRRGLVGRVDLERQLRRHARVPGARSADAVVAFADGRSSGVGTSRSRVLFRNAGLPPPELRFVVPDLADVAGAGSAGSESDFGYPLDRVLGEFDGWEEFGRLLEPAPPDWRRELVVAAERARHERLVAAGWRVVRWTWADLARPADLIARMREALVRSGGVTGSAGQS